MELTHLHTANVVSSPSNPKKFDHLVLGPAAGRGLPNRVQCQGHKAINWTPFSTFSPMHDIHESTSFVTVFSLYNNSPGFGSPDHRKSSDIVIVGNAAYDKPGRSLALLNAFIKFIEVSMPRSNVIILTALDSELHVHQKNVEVVPVEGDFSRGNLMLQRMRSYIVFLESRLKRILHGQHDTNHFIFTDSDVAVVDDLGHIFEKYLHFDLAVTFRNNKNQPLNSGFIAVRGTIDGISKAKALLERVLNVYILKFGNASRMLGDQLALAWVIKSHPSFDAKRFSRHEAFVDEIHGALVLFLPCAVYNWTPPEGAGQFHGMPLDVKVIHFKGSRKRLMLESWNLFNSSSPVNFFNILCVILKSGRTKYDF
ncbi:uncharacterized protein LOC18426846 isoform X2 [Amborella trichopoda]|nr:uncharacterized protein LOC18426846 isoform X2 [Amborella trichopoda]|eukprot:XP_006833547.3 uncharacterized protein LOC18426846 isoform X2 [Amborella trichopoda]